MEVQAVQFLDGVVSIAYAEDRDQSLRVGMSKTIYVKHELIESELDEVLSALNDIIDKGLLDVRNPQETIKARTSENNQPASSQPNPG